MHSVVSFSHPHGDIQVFPLVNPSAGREAVQVFFRIVESKRKGTDFDVVLRVKFAIRSASGSQIPTELVL